MYSSIGEQEKWSIKNRLHSSFPIIEAVIEGVQQGQIFMNARQDYWVLHKAGFSEVFLNEDDGKELVDFILESTELPRYFHIYDPTEELIGFFKLKADAFNVRKRTRIQLKYGEGQRVKNYSDDRLLCEFTISNVTPYNYESLSVFNLDLTDKFWNGKDEFVKNAFGVFIKNNKDMPVTLCYAAAVADGKSEIDVVTLDSFRGKGLAKMAVASFVTHIAHYNLIPNWDCFKDNRASLRTALSIGFLKSLEYSFLSVFKNI